MLLCMCVFIQITTSSWPVGYNTRKDILVSLHLVVAARSFSMAVIIEERETMILEDSFSLSHDDVIKWKHFPSCWPFVRGIHRWPVNSRAKASDVGGALMFHVICAWINDWANSREAGDLRSHRAHHDVTVMWWMATIYEFVLINIYI